MRVYLCVNQARGLELLRRKSGEKGTLNCSLCTQKKTAIAEYKTKNRDYIRESLKKTNNNKYRVMILLYDIPYEQLTYISGDELDPYSTEYDSKMDTVYGFNFNRLLPDKILEVESKHFYLSKTRLKIKKSWTLMQ